MPAFAAAPNRSVVLLSRRKPKLCEKMTSAAGSTTPTELTAAGLDYQESLRDNLTKNDKVVMNMLTMLAEDYQNSAAEIVQVIQQHIQQVYHKNIVIL